MDPYQILGIAPGASDEEVSAAYRRLAKRWHPDVNPDDPDASRKMAAVNNAYEEIRNRRANRAPGGPGTDPDELIREGRWEEALDALQCQTRRDARWHFRMAVVFLRLGNPAVAREYAEAAARMDPADPDIARLRDSLGGRPGGRIVLRNPLWTVLKYLFYLWLAQGLLRLLFA